MAAPDVLMHDRTDDVLDDPTDPNLMTPAQRLIEVAALLALGLRRWSALRVAGDEATDPSASPESLAPADSKTISANPT